MNNFNSNFDEWSKLPGKTRYYPSSWNYAGEWEITSSYSVGDVVRVIPGKTYSLPWIATPTVIPVDAGDSYNTTMNFPVGSALLGTLQIGDNQYPYITPNYIAIPGVYVCVANVPSLPFIVQQLESDQNTPIVDLGVNTLPGIPLASYPSWVQKFISYIRFSNINYFPVFPEMPTVATMNYLDVNKLNGRYWELVSLLPTTMTVCGVGNYLVDAQLLNTGSANYSGSAS